MEIGQITNVGLQLNDGQTVIPVIRVVLNDPDTDYISRDDYVPNILEPIYQRAAGCVSTTSYSISAVKDGVGIVDELKTDGTYWIGSRRNPGFALAYIVEYREDPRYGVFQGIKFFLYYNGRMVCSGTNDGTATYRNAYLYIFTDNDYHLMFNTWTNLGFDLIKEESENYMGISYTNGYLIATVGGYTFVDWLGIYSGFWLIDAPTTAEYNIRDYITSEIDPTDTDPYQPAGNSTTGGGTGDFDGTGDDIDFPSLPTLSAVDTGFITLFNPSISQLQSLANYLWSGPFDLETYKKIFADPMDCILGLSIVPVAVPNGGSKAVTVGNISTGISMTTAQRQYVEIDCGSLNVNEFWGAYLDYAPFTKCEIYLPYIGTHPLDVDDVMNKTVHVKYHVDILSGACSAYVKCGGSVMYEFIGQCSSSIPISANDWTNVINGVLSIAGSIGSMVATGGASAPTAITAIASTAVNSLKPTVEKSGSMSGTGGMLGVQTPYLILSRPKQAKPAKQNAFTGYPSFITSSLGSLSGYTEVEYVHLDNIPATDSEINEIENLLKSGVIF